MMALTVFLAALLASGALPYRSAHAGANPASEMDLMVDRMAQSRVVLVGESHSNPQHPANFSKILSRFEARYPRRLSAVGLEIFANYQSILDAYFASGEPDLLLHTPDNEILHGHTGTPESEKNYLGIYENLLSMDALRPTTESIRTIALDEKPDSSIPFNTWAQNHSPLEAFLWGASRDKDMLARIRPALLQAEANDKTVFIYIGSGHIQKRGGLEGTFGGHHAEVSFLGKMIFDLYPTTLAVDQSGHNPGCLDKIDETLMRAGTTTNEFIDLASDPLGLITDFECENAGLPKSLAQVAYFPQPYAARDHYDYYIFSATGL